MHRQSVDRAAIAVELRGQGDDRAPALNRPILIGQQPNPAGQPVEEILRRQRRIEVRAEVVDRARAGASTSSKAAGQRPGHVVVLVQPGQVVDQRPRRERARRLCRGSLDTLDHDLVVVREDERVRLDLQSLGLLAPLAGQWVGPEDANVFDHLRSAKTLQRGKDLAAQHGTAEWPARAVGTADDRVEVAEQHVEGLILQAIRIAPLPRAKSRDHGDATVDGRLDEDARADEPRLVQPLSDLLERPLWPERAGRT